MSSLLELVVGVIAAMLVNDARMAAAEAASEAAEYDAAAGAFEPMASRILSPACKAFPDRTAEMSTCLWSLASSCTGSAIIALGPNTKKSNRGRVFTLLGSLWPEGFVHSAVQTPLSIRLKCG